MDSHTMEDYSYKSLIWGDEKPDHSVCNFWLGIGCG